MKKQKQGLNSDGKLLPGYYYAIGGKILKSSPKKEVKEPIIKSKFTQSKETDFVKRKKENILIAERILKNIGIKKFRFADYSDSNYGISVYFLTEDDKKLRVSDHSVLSNSRMQNEYLFSFDAITIGREGKKIKDLQKSNALMAKSYKLI